MNQEAQWNPCFPKLVVSFQKKSTIITYYRIMQDIWYDLVVEALIRTILRHRCHLA